MGLRDRVVQQRSSRSPRQRGVGLGAADMNAKAQERQRLADFLLKRDMADDMVEALQAVIADFSAGRMGREDARDKIRSLAEGRRP